MKISKSSELFDRPTSIRNYRYIDISLELSVTVNKLIDCNPYFSRDKLAIEMGKTRSEIDGMLTGFHNFTLKEIAHLEEYFAENLIKIKTNNEIHNNI